ncbi:unnamed protein product [Darwinula stevensoni]|uniref:NIPSNAP domain-containing protein n=1 Tax=Darwinula stevensoni TaxID=69355 RepID=A0A7R8X2Q2_9CRUS|nr:unnamed protein product [Darwinula stevensoni]CAG0884176.1 unnamed protein product [Darwinula stevensoni]
MATVSAWKLLTSSKVCRCVKSDLFPRALQGKRSYSTKSDEPKPEESGFKEEPDSDKTGWLSKFLSRKIEPTKESHSRLLSEKDIIYELQTHNVKPSKMDPYIQKYAEYVKAISTRGDVKKELVGSWIVGVGDLDQCLHLWKYPGGYSSVDESAKTLRSDPEYVQLKRERTPYLRSRRCQYLLHFSFWPPITPRQGHNLYEIRSYTLRPGSMIEWGNNWARGINFRRSNEAPFAGFFSQVGVLYQVHHIWLYSSLLSRKETREVAWQQPGWDRCVSHTVPLIKHMESRILLPTPFSPTQ